MVRYVPTSISEDFTPAAAAQNYIVAAQGVAHQVATSITVNADELCPRTIDVVVAADGMIRHVVACVSVHARCPVRAPSSNNMIVAALSMPRNITAGISVQVLISAEIAGDKVVATTPVVAQRATRITVDIQGTRPAKTCISTGDDVVSADPMA